jgi:hypothetical protein
MLEVYALFVQSKKVMGGLSVHLVAWVLGTVMEMMHPKLVVTVLLGCLMALHAGILASLHAPVVGAAALLRRHAVMPEGRS